MLTQLTLYNPLCVKLNQFGAHMRDKGSETKPTEEQEKERRYSLLGAETACWAAQGSRVLGTRLGQQ